MKIIILSLIALFTLFTNCVYTQGLVTTPKSAIPRSASVPVKPLNSDQDIQKKLNDILTAIQRQDEKINKIQEKLEQVASRVLPKILLDESFSNPNAFNPTTGTWKNFANEKFTTYKLFEIGPNKVLTTKAENGYYCAYSKIQNLHLSSTPFEMKFKVKIAKNDINSAYLQLYGCGANDVNWDSRILRFGPSLGGGFGNKKINLEINWDDKENYLKFIQSPADVNDGVNHVYTLRLDPKDVANNFKIYLDGRLVAEEKLNSPLQSLSNICKVAICAQNEKPSKVEIDDIFVAEKADICNLN